MAAGKIAAHEALGRAAAAVTHLDQVGIGCVIRTDQTACLHRCEVQVAAHQVPVFVWKQDQIPGGHVERFHAVGQPHLAAAFRKEMEEHRARPRQGVP